MIFYFSGTGNSRWVAETLASELNDRLIFIPDASRQEHFSYELHPTEKLGFVFPCYAWGIPTFISQFIKRLNIPNVGYLYYICTCGDDTGRLQQEFCRLVLSKGWECQLGYDIMMPESYVCLPGFDVDSDVKSLQKTTKAQTKLSQAIEDITDQREGAFATLPGGFTWTKSVLLRWAFNKWLMNPAPFHVEEEGCSGCGKCELQCPFHNITLTENHPTWGNNCVMCLRCYHSCPHHAINWGSFTKYKGQYLKR